MRRIHRHAGQLAFALLAAHVLLAGCVASGGERGPIAQAQPLRDEWAFDPIRDRPILDSVEAELLGDQRWGSFPPVPDPMTPDRLTSSVPAAESSIVVRIQGVYPGIAVSCARRRVCEIPVLIREAPDKHCYAVLPFERLIIGPGQPRPEKLKFVLAKWDSSTKTWSARSAADAYRFNRTEQVPIFGKREGVFIHELHDAGSGNHRREDLTLPYFINAGMDTQGMVSTWEVGSVNTWKPPRGRPENTIGRVVGGVMAAALVVNGNVPVGDHRRHCKPVDPIIVNVAN